MLRKVKLINGSMEMVNLSKSKYCNVWTCPKMEWLNRYKPEVRTQNPGAEARMETGNEVGDLAMELFGDFVEVTAYSGDKLDLSKMILNTKEEIDKGTKIICEASFSYEGLYCAVDILKKSDNGWEIYEVKSSSWHEDKPHVKDIYLADMAYQKYVLTKCGVNVTGVNLVRLNGDYVRGEELDVKQLFNISNVDDLLEKESACVEHYIEIAGNVLNSKEEPDIDIDIRCKDPYDCAYWEYCTRNIPKPTVFELYDHSKKKGMKEYHAGRVCFEDFKNADVRSDLVKRQLEYFFEEKGTYIDKDGIRDFMDQLSYPLYFLDFETEQPAIPKYPNSKPYAQIPFQYSLHYIEEEGGTLKHKEFLGISGEDPRRAIAESLVLNIPMNVCVTAYNKTFECSRLEELASLFPDLAKHLLDIRDNIVDLLVPFKSGYYYNKNMGGSFSIKSVLPAIYPNDPSLDYHNLEDIQNGGDAMSIFPKIKDMEPEEQIRIRKNLLKYCELDTYAMVKVWEELIRASK